MQSLHKEKKRSNRMTVQGLVMNIILKLSLIKFSLGAYYFANLNYKSTFNKTYGFPFNDLVKYQVNDLKTYEYYSNGTLVFTSLSGLNPYQMVYFDSSNPLSTYNQQRMISFSFDDWRSWQLHFLLSTGQLVSCYPYYDYQLARLNVSQINIQQNSVLLNTNQTFFVINIENDSIVINRIFRQQQLNMTLVEMDAAEKGYNITDFQPIPNITVTNILGDQIKGTVCKKIFHYSEYLVLWNSSSYIEIYQCGYFQCILQGTIINDFQNISWVAENVNFGYNCDRLFVSYGNIDFPSVYNTSGFRQAFYPFLLEQIIDFKPLAYSAYEASILLSNGSLIVFSALNNTFMKEYANIGNLTDLTRFVWSPRRIIMNYEDRFEIYKLECWQLMYFSWWRGQCKNCSETCASCDEQYGYCLTCIEGYEINVLNPMVCIPSIISNTTNNSSQNDSSNPLLNNNTNINNNISLNENSTNQRQELEYGAYYLYELNTAKSILGGFYFIGQIIAVIFKILEILPLAWLFLTFMNFWSICSFYVLLNVEIPQYLYLILKIIWDKINTSIFKLDDTATQIYPFEQKLPYLSEQFGISSSFILNNFENFIVMTISITIAKLLIVISSRFQKNGWIYKNIYKSLDFQQIVSSQFISSAASFFLPFPLIIKMLNKLSWKEIINLSLHSLFIGFTMILPFLIIKSVENKNQKNSIKKSGNNKIKSIQNKKNQRQKTKQFIVWIYDSNCNTVIPLLCMIGQPSLYLVFGIFYFAYGVYLAFKQKQFRINCIILALYHLLFHLSFTIVSFFGRFSVFIKHNSAMICALILILGGIHEILTLFFQIFFFIFKNISKNWKLMNRIKDETKNSTQINLKNKNQSKLANKMKIKVQEIHSQQISNQESQIIQKKSLNKVLHFKTKLYEIKQYPTIDQSGRTNQTSFFHDQNQIQRQRISKTKKTVENIFNHSNFKNNRKFKGNSYIEHKIKISQILPQKKQLRLAPIIPQVLNVEGFQQK